MKTGRGSGDKQSRETRRPLLWPQRRPVPRSQSAAAGQTCSPSAAPSRWLTPPLYCKTQKSTQLVTARRFNHWKEICCSLRLVSDLLFWFLKKNLPNESLTLVEGVGCCQLPDLRPAPLVEQHLCASSEI